jgi:general secretion pathway protein J
MTRPSGGFTLLELIVVLGIFGVLSMMAYGGLASVLKSREHVAASIARTSALQKAYQRLRNDFQQVRARGVRDEFGEAQPALVVSRDGSVEFTRGGWRNPMAQPRSSLERVAYHLDDKKRLVRTTWRVLDRTQSTPRRDLVLLDDVEEVAWRFLDKSQQWQTTWPAATLVGGLNSGSTSATEALDVPPRAVELTLQLKDAGELKFLFSATNEAPPKGGKK